MLELLRLLAGPLLFFLDPHEYALVNSGGTAEGSAFIDLQKGDLIWRLARDRGQLMLDVRLVGKSPEESYSTDILIQAAEREFSKMTALLTDNVVNWLGANLELVEASLMEDRANTIELWERMEARRADELFGSSKRRKQI